MSCTVWFRCTSTTIAFRPICLKGSPPPEKVCKFTFFNVLQSIRTREDDCSVLFGMLERTLYKDRSDG